MSYRKRRSNAFAEQTQGRTLDRAPVAEMLNHRHADAASRADEQLSATERRRAQKVLVFPLITDSRAPLTGPRISDKDRSRGLELLGGRPRCNGKPYPAPVRTAHYEALPIAA